MNRANPFCIENYVRRRAGHVLVAYNSKLYMWGGYMEEPHEGTYNLMTARDSHFHDPSDIWIYEPLLNLWTRKTCIGNIPPTLSGATAGVIGNFMYVFGGFNGDQWQNEGTNSLWRLDLDQYKWKRMSPSGFLPFPCDKSCSWVYLDRLYIFGGYGPPIPPGTKPPVYVSFDKEADINSRGWLDQLVYYEASTNSWVWPRKEGIKACPRAAHAAALLKSTAYVFGGRHQNSRLNDFYSIDLETHSWARVPLTADSPLPMGRSWHTLNSISEDKLVLYGGFSSECQVLNDCWIAEFCSSDGSSGKEVTWKEVDLAYDHGEPRCNHCTASLPMGQVFIVSGLTQPYYITMHLLIEHAEDMLKLRFSPPSLFELSLEYVSRSKNVSKRSWTDLSFLVRKILEVRTCPFEIHGI